MNEHDALTAAAQLLRLCSRLGVKYIFSNLGSDHPAFIHAFAKMTEEGIEMPKVVVCPHEMTTLSAAHGYAAVTRQPQLVLVHVDVGTANLGGSVHNAARGRVPALVVAGLSPVSTNPATVGHRNEYIHYIQDAPRQHALVDQYMKWSYELRSAEMTEQVVNRAYQLACSTPQGPVYLTGTREVWEAKATPVDEQRQNWALSRLGGLSRADAARLHDSLLSSSRPLIMTTYIGYQKESVEKLVRLSERFGIGICELGPHYMNFPGDHPNHLGYQRNTLVDEADLILLIDVDVPWLESKVTPRPGAKVFHIDIDTLKERLGFWHFPVQGCYQADSGAVLDQLLAMDPAIAESGRAARLAWIADAKKRVELRIGTPPTEGPITPAELTLAVRELVNDHTIVVVESPSTAAIIPSVLKMNRPGSYYGNHGAGLGWGANAAIGVKLAIPDAEVISLLGDGCFVFSVPSSAYWVAGTYQTPHLTIIYNNSGWRSPRMSTVYVHPDGPAERNDTYFVSVGVGARLSKIAEATGGAVGFEIEDRARLKMTLREAMQVVRSGKAAVVDVRLVPVSGQVLS